MKDNIVINQLDRNSDDINFLKDKTSSIDKSHAKLDVRLSHICEKISKLDNKIDLIDTSLDKVKSDVADLKKSNTKSESQKEYILKNILNGTIPKQVLFVIVMIIGAVALYDTPSPTQKKELKELKEYLIN